MEVVSASAGRNGRVLKMPIYAREGVGHLWLVSLHLRTLEGFLLERQRWVVASTHSDAESLRAEPFDSVEMDMNRWWLEQEG